MAKRTMTALLVAMALGSATAAWATDLDTFRGKFRKYAPDYSQDFTGPGKGFCQCTDGGPYDDAIGWMVHATVNLGATGWVVRTYCAVQRFDSSGAQYNPAWCLDFVPVVK